MLFLEIVTALLAGYGMFNIVTEFVEAPNKRARRAVLAHKKGPRGLTESIVIPMAEFISKRIRLSETRKDSLQKSLYSAELHMTPEFYVSKAIASGFLVSLFAIPMLFILPLMALACVAAGFIVFFKEVQSVSSIVQKKREKIEGELVLFASTIQQSLLGSRDVVKIFESYRKVCGPQLTHELDITLADMKTGNYESALIRFEARLNSSSMSQLIRGLLAVMRGDEQSTYFEMLTHDLIVEEKERMKRQALKRPEKLKVSTFLMIFCFALVYFYAIGYQIATTFTQIF